MTAVAEAKATMSLQWWRLSNIGNGGNGSENGGGGSGGGNSGSDGGNSGGGKI